MWEICISEFHMKHKEFLFDFSPQQVFLLAEKRSERMERVKKGGRESPPPREGSPIYPGDVRILGGVFSG
jgi:hypothetical protein